MGIKERKDQEIEKNAKFDQFILYTFAGIFSCIEEKYTNITC